MIIFIINLYDQQLLLWKIGIFIFNDYELLEKLRLLFFKAETVNKNEIITWRFFSSFFLFNLVLLNTAHDFNFKCKMHFCISYTFIYFFRPSVRKCAVLTLSHCLQLIDSESAYLMAFPKLEKCLSDPELEVVSVVIPTLHKVIKVSLLSYILMLLFLFECFT